MSSIFNFDYDPTIAGGVESDPVSLSDYNLTITTAEFEPSNPIGNARLVLDINPGIGPYGRPNNSGIYSFTEFNGKLFFTAVQDATGRELWVSDGTADGTQLVKDINPGSIGENDYHQGPGDPISSIGSIPIEFEGKLFFTADDGINGSELWVSDGTTAGTQLFIDINPGISSNGNPNESSPFDFIEFDRKLFFTADDGLTGRELWVSDGTTAGTELLKDLNLGVNDSNPYGFIEFDGKLFFATDDGLTGRELWVSDGTAAGTQKIKDINILSSLDYGKVFYEVNGKLFFLANDGTTGLELWVSDGTTEGTQLVKDINTTIGSYGSDISNFTEVDGKLFL